MTNKARLAVDLEAILVTRRIVIKRAAIVALRASKSPRMKNMAPEGAGLDAMLKITTQTNSLQILTTVQTKGKIKRRVEKTLCR